jgi:hypothetical protein
MLPIGSEGVQPPGSLAGMQKIDVEVARRAKEALGEDSRGS